MTELTITFPAPCELINANHRMHWAPKAALTRTWRDTACRQAKAQGLARVVRAHVVITISFNDNYRRDVGNLAPTAKACLDGIVDAGCLPDDNDAHVTGPDLRRGPKIAGRVPMVTVELRDAQ